MSQVKIAVIGAGHLGRIHTRLLRTIPRFELVGIVDPVATVREAMAAEFQTPVFAELRGLEGKIDAVIVATPTSGHLETALWCLERGVHCFVEKPLVRSARHADILVQVARQRGLTLQVGHVERFNPAWTAVRPLLRQVTHVAARRTSSYTGRSVDIGVVFDLMIHDLDLVLDCIASPLVSVSASGDSVLGNHEDWAEAHLQFENGATANLYASRVSREATRRMSLTARGFSAELDFAKGVCDVVEASEELINGAFDAEKLTDDERRTLPSTLFDRWLVHRSLPTEPVNAIERELIDFCEAIEQKRQPVVSGKTARSAIEVAERIIEALTISRDKQRQAFEDEELPGVIPAAHRFGVRRAS